MFDSDFTREMAKEKILVDWFVWNLRFTIFRLWQRRIYSMKNLLSERQRGYSLNTPDKGGGRGKMDGSNNNNKQNIDVPASQLIVD